jgi:predicted TIM-barrel fold metal-dependent hydrolase
MSAVIDVRPHVISTDEKRYPREPLGGSQSDWSRERPVSAEAMIAAMDQAGVSRSALVQAATCYGYDNRYLADSVVAHPQRFAGVFSVDVFRPDAKERIAHWLAKGLAGLRVFIAGHTMASKDARLDDPRSFPAWTMASDTGSRCACSSARRASRSSRRCSRASRAFASCSITWRGRRSRTGRPTPRRRAFSRSRAIPTSF